MSIGSERSTPRRLPSRMKPGLGALAVGCAAGLVAVYGVFVRTRLGQEIDQAAFEGRSLADREARDAAGDALRRITGPTLGLAVFVLASVAVLRGRTRLALVPLVGIAGAVATSEVLKRWVLDRPDLIGEPQYSNSFPSGHATIALAVAWAAIVVAPPAARRPVAVIGTLLAMAIGIGAIAAAWHRPSDVVGGYMVATAWAAAALGTWVALFPDRVDMRAIRGVRPVRVAARYERIAALLGLGGIAAAIGLTLADSHGEIAWLDPGPDFVGSAIIVAGVAAGLVGALVLASGRITPKGRLRRLGLRQPR